MAAAALTMAAPLLGIAPSYAAASPYAARPHVPRTEIVSVAADGTRGDQRSISPAISYDGRYVAFDSEASNLIPGGTGTGDVFLRDLRTGTIVRAGVGDDGRRSDDGSWSATLSGNGRVVGFTSSDPALAPGDRPPHGSYAYVRDLRTGRTESVGIGVDGVPFRWAAPRALSADGRYVVFAGAVPTDKPPFSRSTLYLRDRVRGTTELISGAVTPEMPGLGSASISADGRYVAFTTYDDARINEKNAVYVRDRRTGRLENVDHTPGDPRPVSHWYGHASLSADGRFIAYVTNRDGKSARNPTALWEVFVHDLRTGRTTLAAAAPDGGPLGKAAHEPRISPDGRYVAYGTGACATAEPHCGYALYVRDLRRHGREATRRVSVAMDGGFPDHGAEAPVPARGGCTVVFTSDATNLVLAHPQRVTDVYARHLC
ncbi:hypothetical protein CTZ27_10855 [Streptomyces griseocarneus]|nr:hypothetical protein CTZ27_10855 [Streptomyces griseocarneus]